MSDAKGKNQVNVYILSNEIEQHIFDLWDIIPESTDRSGWDSLSRSSIRSFQKKLKDLSNGNKKMKAVVELMVSNQGIAFLKLYQTVFV